MQLGDRKKKNKKKKGKGRDYVNRGIFSEAADAAFFDIKTSVSFFCDVYSSAQPVTYDLVRTTI